MAASYQKIILSGSTHGRPIPVTGLTASGGNTIHTGVTGAAESLDEVWLWVYNSATASREINIVWGSTAALSRFTYTVTGRDKDGWQLIVPGHVIRNELVIKAYATVADVLAIMGFVNRLAS